MRILIIFNKNRFLVSSPNSHTILELKILIRNSFEAIFPSFRLGKFRLLLENFYLTDSLLVEEVFKDFDQVQIEEFSSLQENKETMTDECLSLHESCDSFKEWLESQKPIINEKAIKIICSEIEESKINTLVNCEISFEPCPALLGLIKIIRCDNRGFHAILRFLKNLAYHQDTRNYIICQSPGILDFLLIQIQSDNYALPAVECIAGFALNKEFRQKCRQSVVLNQLLHETVQAEIKRLLLRVF